MIFETFMKVLAILYLPWIALYIAAQIDDRRRYKKWAEYRKRIGAPHDYDTWYDLQNL